MRQMEMVEMVFRGDLGLEQWVQELAASVEGVLLSHGVEWKRNFPVTLREALRLGLQQHVVGTHACAPQDRDDGCYRVWLALPEAGVGAWAHELASHIQSGCGLSALRHAPLNLDLEGLLRQHLEPHLQKASSALLFAGQVYR